MPDEPAEVLRAPIPVGIEIDADLMRFTVLARQGSTVRRWRSRFTRPQLPTEALTNIEALVRRAIGDVPNEQAEAALSQANCPVAIGVAFGGAVDAAQGITGEQRIAQGWNQYPLAMHLAERWGAPVTIESATNAAALAEWRIGAGAGSPSLLYVHLGRSVTAALVLDGRVVRGGHGAAGMLAHSIVGSVGPRCSCGATGHLEPLASAQAMVRNMIGRASDSEESAAAMLRVSGGRAEAMTALHVVQLAAEGDPAARDVIAAALDALAIALANAIVLLDPSIILVSGGPSRAKDAFMRPLSERMRSLPGHSGRVPPVVAGSLDPHAALIGARLLATRRFHKQADDHET